MSTETTTATAEAPATPAPAAKTAPAKAKAAPKKTASKPKAKTTAKPAAGLTGPQHRVLKALAKSKNPLTRKQIAEKAFNGNSVNFVPILDPMVGTLLRKHELGGDDQPDVPKETVFEITAAGRREAEKAPPVTARTNGAANHAHLKAGQVITREYNGKEVKVKVTADGFEYKGKTYPSLTAAAQAVRGTDQAVNGWQFFRLIKNGDGK